LRWDGHLGDSMFACFHTNLATSFFCIAMSPPNCGLILPNLRFPWLVLVDFTIRSLQIVMISSGNHD
jgi:hypothetical protein